VRNGSGVAELHDRLLSRRDEIEQAILTRVYAVSDPSGVADPTYVEGLRAAVTAAIDYGLAGIQSSERNSPPIPTALLVQARNAARSGVGLDTVLRRYVAGYALLGDFLIGEAGESSVSITALKRTMRVQATLLDRALGAIAEEHCREQRRPAKTSEQRRTELVQRLLDGELLDTEELAYDFETTHLALVTEGPGAVDFLRALAADLDRRLLVVCPTERASWAWLGGRREVGQEELMQAIASTVPPQVSLAIGESAQCLEGWRRSHRQARAAMSIALRSSETYVRYADVALLASILQDELLTTALQETYLKPFDAERDGGKMTREILRIYFASGCNVSSAAATLGLNRNTIAKRIRAVEETIGRPLASCAAECEAALRLDQLESRDPQMDSV
jgi:hypothetical protein